MAIGRHIEEFHGLPVFNVEAALADGKPLPAAGEVAWRLHLDYDGDGSFEELWESFLTAVDGTAVRALVIGSWWGDDAMDPLTESLALIVRSAERLPALRALFLGEVTYEENEISWIQPADLTPLLEAYPRLEELVARGAYSTYGEVAPPYLRPLRHEHLRALRFESGGLSGTVSQAIGACELPALERLELWLGTEWYGADTTLDDLAPLLDGGRLPALRHLGLENSDLTDQLAAALAGAPVVAQLSKLSLALGTLSDQGAAALLAGQPLTHLAALDLHHHYLSEEMQQRLKDTVGAAGTALDLSQQQDLDDDRPYVANGE
ncbi:STM4015 family protein [Kitasatospora sp. NBC_00240]|uniref:STM4015 family protein n=1 Tax=Kitasatospora sp. NBC_00240 TaxID=2903567 RepID=UPI002252418C|nr:STM4015 family protein [Kitasatospora sp. NBC_00240]MCX5210809.1 STM4015 family protein [Kitasatospora sp. NBC_00240]